MDMKSSTEPLSPRPVPSATWSEEHNESGDSGRLRLELLFWQTLSDFSSDSKPQNKHGVLLYLHVTDAVLGLVWFQRHVSFLEWNIQNTEIRIVGTRRSSCRHSTLCAEAGTCRIWKTALEWSPAVILSSSPSTNLFVEPPHPFTNSCMLRDGERSYILNTGDIVPERRRMPWSAVPDADRALHVAPTALPTCPGKTSVWGSTWGHTAPLCHLHRQSTAGPSHREADPGRWSCFGGSGCCRHC